MAMVYRVVAELGTIAPELTDTVSTAALHPTAARRLVPSAQAMHGSLAGDANTRLLAGILRIVALEPTTARQYCAALDLFLADAGCPVEQLITSRVDDLVGRIESWTVRWLLAGGSTSRASLLRAAATRFFGIPATHSARLRQVVRGFDRIYQLPVTNHLPLPPETIWIAAGRLFADGHVDAALLTLLAAASLCRPAELLHLHADDLERALAAHAASGSSDVPLSVDAYDSKTRASTIRAQGRGRGTRMFTIDVYGRWAIAAATLLARRRREDGHYRIGGEQFDPPSSGSARLGSLFTAAWRAAVPNADRVADLFRITFYGYRTGMVTALFNAGVDSDEVHRRGRWSTTGSTVRAHYLQPLRMARVRAVVGRLLAHHAPARLLSTLAATAGSTLAELTNATTPDDADALHVALGFFFF